MFDMNDPTNRDRVAMLHDRRADDRGSPADRRRPEHGRAALRASTAGPDAVKPVNPHLHNVPLQIAAERGLPALPSGSGSSSRWSAICAKRFAAGRHRDARGRRRSPPIVALLAAGLFEYNFGDSEVLMLFLLIVTLPAAADRVRRRMTLPPARPPRRARDLVGRFAGQPVLVVGDVMLDRFIVGRVTRISPEAPVPVVRFQSDYVRLGGAANVAHNLAALGGAGVAGRHRRRRRRRPRGCASSSRSPASNVDGLVEDRGRPTTEKVRVVTERNQQVARIDYEHDADAAGAVESAIVDRIARLGARRDGAARVRLSEGRGHAGGHRGAR